MPALRGLGLRRLCLAAAGMPVSRALPRRGPPRRGRGFTGAGRARAPARGRVAAALRRRWPLGRPRLRCAGYRSALSRFQPGLRPACAPIMHGFTGRSPPRAPGPGTRVFPLHGRRREPVRLCARHAAAHDRQCNTAGAVTLDLGIPRFFSAWHRSGASIDEAICMRLRDRQSVPGCAPRRGMPALSGERRTARSRVHAGRTARGRSRKILQCGARPGNFFARSAYGRNERDVLRSYRECPSPSRKESASWR
jgi:hypothetical protein